VAPHAVETLQALDGVRRLSLVTGNLEPIARLKLRAAGLGGWFADGQGGFGSDSEDRSDLPAVARRRAGAAWNGGAPWPRERTVVVGDTPRDIACARADGVRVVAVATGPFAAADLHGADVVLEDLRGLAAALDALG
jgi:phosphoglycolate phosphatase-like HAD superfamily hydrolase